MVMAALPGRSLDRWLPRKIHLWAKKRVMGWRMLEPQMSMEARFLKAQGIQLMLMPNSR